MGEASSRPSLRPRSFRGRRVLEKLGRTRRENEGVCEMQARVAAKLHPDLWKTQWLFIFRLPTERDVRFDAVGLRLAIFPVRGRVMARPEWLSP